MPPTFYDWISNEESELEVDISALDFADSPYLTITSSAPHNKQVKIDKFCMKRDDESGLLLLQVEMSFYWCGGDAIGLIYSLGSIPLANWDNCNIKLLHFLAILMEYIFSDTYKMCRVSTLDFLAHSDHLQIQHIFSPAFLAACIIAHRKENLVGMLQFPEDELDRAIMGSKLDFLTAMGNDGVDEFMLMVASTFTQDYYDGIPDDQADAVMKPFSFSKSLNSDPRSWMIRTYTPLLLMDFMRRNNESCEQRKDERLHYALTLNHLQAVIQLRYTVEIFPAWITVEIHIHDVECDITPFSFHQNPERDKELKELGLKSERHFPSKILLSISPLLDQSNILNFSRTKSCQDPGTIRYQSAQTMGIQNCNWKFYQSRENTNSTGMLEWALHDNGTGKKVVSMTEPSMDSKKLNRLKRSCAWFRDRHCSSSTNKVGVGFTDDCGHSFTWKVNRDLEGQTLRWLLCGFIWLTYWPVEYDTSYCENICHEFSEHIEVKLVPVDDAIVPFVSSSMTTHIASTIAPLLSSTVPTIAPLLSSTVIAPIPHTTSPLVSSSVDALVPLTRTPLVSSIVVVTVPPVTKPLVSSDVVAQIPFTTSPLVSSTVVASVPLTTTPLVSSTVVAPTPPTTSPLVSSDVVAQIPSTTSPLVSSTVVASVPLTTTPLVSSTVVAPAPPTTTPLVSSDVVAQISSTTSPLVSSTVVASVPLTTTPLVSSTVVAPAPPTTTPLVPSTMAALETPTITPLVPSTLVEPTSPTTIHIISSLLAALVGPASVVASEQRIESSAQSTSQSPSSPKLIKEITEERLRQRKGARPSRHIASSIVPIESAIFPFVSSSIATSLPSSITPLVSSIVVAPIPPPITPLVSSTMAASIPSTTNPLVSSMVVGPTPSTTNPLVSSSVAMAINPTPIVSLERLVQPSTSSTSQSPSSGSIPYMLRSRKRAIPK